MDGGERDPRIERRNGLTHAVYMDTYLCGGGVFKS